MLVLVADQGVARILSREDSGSPLVEQVKLTSPGGRMKARDINSDAPGRVFDSGGQGRHSVGRADPAAHDAEVFAKQVAMELQREAQGNSHHQIVIIAAPKFLGLLRQQLSKQVESQLAGEIDKDMVSATIDDITSLVSDRLKTRPV